MNFHKIDASELHVRRWSPDSPRLVSRGSEASPNLLRYAAACAALLLLAYAAWRGGTVLLIALAGGVLAILAVGTAACIYVQNNTD